MTETSGFLQVEGWVMNGLNRYMIDPAGDTVRLPLLVLYADRFWNRNGVPLALSSQPISVEFTAALAHQKHVWTLGERIRVSGQVAAINVTRASQQKAVQRVRQRIVTLDRNELAHFWTGMLRRDDQLARVTNFRNQYLAGKIGLNRLQNEENRIFSRERHVWLVQLAIVHDKQLAIRRQAAPTLLANSRPAYLLKNSSLLSHAVSGRARVAWLEAPNHSARGGVRSVFRATPRQPVVERKLIKDQYNRAELLVPLERFRKNWLKAGRPVDWLPSVPADLRDKQAEWLEYEANKRVKV
ncbi:hypothetical protein [Lacticaseibacillus camelliae]|nr:hypothetical protein [Lacticaseibacillus camelliae]